MKWQTYRHPHQQDRRPILEAALAQAEQSERKPEPCQGWLDGCTCPDCEKVNEELWQELNRPRPVRVW